MSQVKQGMSILEAAAEDVEIGGMDTRWSPIDRLDLVNRLQKLAAEEFFHFFWDKLMDALERS